MKYVSVNELQIIADNSIDHTVTPNDFQRLSHVDIVKCKYCRYCATYPSEETVHCRAGHNIRDQEGFCSDGREKTNRS